MIEVKLFAVARQLAGAPQVSVEIAEGASVADLRAAIAAQHPPLAELLGHVMIAVNSAYAGDQQRLASGDEVACIPPVSGG